MALGHVRVPAALFLALDVRLFRACIGVICTWAITNKSGGPPLENLTGYVWIWNHCKSHLL